MECQNPSSLIKQVLYFFTKIGKDLFEIRRSLKFVFMFFQDTCLNDRHASIIVSDI